MVAISTQPIAKPGRPTLSRISKANSFSCQAAIEYAERYAELASQMAAECTDPVRKQELLQIRGVGEVKAIQLQCIGELSKRMAAAGARKGLCFHDPASIADYYMERLRHEDQEVLLCMMLDTKNQLLGEKEITRGTVNATMISPRELFLAALQFRAVHILLVHNHPSGIPEPSGDDITVTRQIRRAGEMLGITLLDHIIIGDHCYTSMLEQGI